VTGAAVSPDFPTTPGAFQTTLRDPNGSNAFVTKLTPDGSGLVYSSYLGGSGSGSYGDLGLGIAVDAAGHAYVTGVTNSSDFPTTPGAFQTSGLGTFVTAFRPDAANLAYSTYIGSTGAGAGIALAADGSVYVTGSTYSPDFPTTPAAFQPTDPGRAGQAVSWVASGRLM
jgi:hypothetical protein